MTCRSDITIVGGGVIGLLTARQWVMQGASVTLLERGRVGQESSWAGGGILSPLYPWRQSDAVNQLARRSLQLYPDLCGRLKEVTGIDPELRWCGMLVAECLSDATEARQWASEYQVCYQDVLPEDSGGLSLSFADLLWLPDVGQVRNPRLLRALRDELDLNSVNIVEHCAIDRCQLRAGRVDALNTNRGEFLVDELVLCAGAWTFEFMRMLLPEFEAPQIAPVKGQMLVFKADIKALPFMVLSGGLYLIPRADGMILVGSTVEQAGFDKRLTEAASQQLRAFAESFLPELKGKAVVRHWSGLRPGTVDGVPYIGRCPELANVSINAGHFRNGLVMAPASVELLFDLMSGRSTQVDPWAYNKLG